MNISYFTKTLSLVLFVFIFSARADESQIRSKVAFCRENPIPIKLLSSGPTDPQPLKVFKQAIAPGPNSIFIRCDAQTSTDLFKLLQDSGRVKQTPKSIYDIASENIISASSIEYIDFLATEAAVKIKDVEVRSHCRSLKATPDAKQPTIDCFIGSSLNI